MALKETLPSYAPSERTTLPLPCYYLLATCPGIPTAVLYRSRVVIQRWALSDLTRVVPVEAFATNTFRVAMLSGGWGDAEGWMHVENGAAYDELRVGSFCRQRLSAFNAVRWTTGVRCLPGCTQTSLVSLDNGGKRTKAGGRK